MRSPPPEPGGPPEGSKPHPEHARAANFILVFGLGLFTLAVGWAAWSEQGEGRPRLSVLEMLVALVAGLSLVGPLVVGAAISIRRHRPSAVAVLAVPLLVAAGVVGFVFTALLTAIRCDTCDEA